MMARLIRALAPLLVAFIQVPLNAESTQSISAQSIDSPELGRAGEYLVGTVTRPLQLPARIQLSATGPKMTERELDVRWWYPAAGMKGEAAVYRHQLKLPDKTAHEIVENGAAYQGAVPLKGKYPLVVISHGFGGWSENLSRLGEHLASRGYIVASIDHRDSSFDTLPGFLISFANVLINRTLDQQQLLARLTDPKYSATEPIVTSIDSRRVALIGYSMGGYGALATAGAGYDPNGTPFSQLPSQAKSAITDSRAKASKSIQALVLIAPWGGQPDNRAWSKESLADMTTPTLIISGDQDDIVNFQQGVRWLFDGLTASDRYLLVYREARHNVAGNAVSPASVLSPAAVGYLLEPVWRQDRINQINQHFVTAFLDTTLRGQGEKRSYLNVPTPVASDGKWPAEFGTVDGGAFSGNGQPAYWRGFQKRWATGLELHHKAGDVKANEP